MGRSIGVEVGGSVIGCRSSGSILLQKKHETKIRMHTTVLERWGGGHLDPLHDFPNGCK